jgi:hypothetical protein
MNRQKSLRPDGANNENTMTTKKLELNNSLAENSRTSRSFLPKSVFMFIHGELSIFDSGPSFTLQRLLIVIELCAPDVFSKP